MIRRIAMTTRVTEPFRPFLHGDARPARAGEAAGHQRMTRRGVSWKGFLRDTRAGATTIAAVAVTIMTVGATALIIDHQWLVDQRDVLKSASDAAAIATALRMKPVLAGNPAITDDDLKAALAPVARRYVLLNLAHLPEARYTRAVATLVLEVIPNRGQGTVDVNAQADLGGLLLASRLPFLSGVTEVESMQVESRVKSAVNPIEVVLAIDTSKSMERALDGTKTSDDTSSRMGIVKQAAKDLVDILGPAADNRVAVGVVPWHVVVRLDDTAMSEWVQKGWAVYPSSRRYAHAYGCNRADCTPLDETHDLPDKPGEDWLGCLGEHRLSEAKKADLPAVENLFDAPSQSAFAQAIFPAGFAKAYECLQPPTPSDLSYQHCYGTEETDVTRVVGGKAAQADCENDGSTIFALSSDSAAITAAIDALEPFGGWVGWTYSTLGVAWGQRLLSHDWNAVWGGGVHPVNPAADSDAGARKAIVLMTDGEDNRCGERDPTCVSSGLGFERSVACTAAKTAGTEIFVVAAMHPDKVSKDLGTGLEACSSKAGNPEGSYVFLNNASAESLRAAFADIAGQLTSLRRLH